MVYHAIGVLFQPPGLVFSFAGFHENAGHWTFELKKSRISSAGITSLLLNKFIDENELHYQVALITMHADAPGMIFNGADVAAATGLPVITDLTAIDTSLGGNGEFFSFASQKLGIAAQDMNEVNKTICVSFMGILRWREEYNFLSSVTGASRNSIGGAVWLGQEA